MCKSTSFRLGTKLNPINSVKTKVQQRALSGEAPRGVWETLQRLVRGDLSFMRPALDLVLTYFHQDLTQEIRNPY